MSKRLLYLRLTNTANITTANTLVQVLTGCEQVEPNARVLIALLTDRRGPVSARLRTDCVAAGGGRFKQKYIDRA